MSEYEKKHDEALLKLCSEDTGYLTVSAVDAFKAGSDFGREYIKAEYDQLIKELEWYKEKFESAANDANESRQAYNELIKDALKLKRTLECFEDTAYGHKATEAIENFDKKYPQLNEKE